MDFGLPTALGKCAVHVDRDAAAACSRCGTFACRACIGMLEGAAYCPPCWHRVSYREEGRQSLVALWVGLGSVFCCPALAPVAIHLGRQAVRAIEQGRAPLGGKLNAQAAVWLGWASVIMFALMMLGTLCVWGLAASFTNQRI